MTDNGRVLQRNSRVEYRAIGDEGGVLLHLDNAGYYGLNPFGALTWQLLDGGTSFAELLERLREHFDDGGPPTLNEDVGDFIDDLVHRDLVLRDPSDG